MLCKGWLERSKATVARGCWTQYIFARAGGREAGVVVGGMAESCGREVGKVGGGLNGAPGGDKVAGSGSKIEGAGKEMEGRQEGKGTRWVREGHFLRSRNVGGGGGGGAVR